MTPSTSDSYFRSGGDDDQRSWSWRCLDAGGAEVSPSSPQTFPSQADAETWLGETWRDLLEEGVEQVTLLDGEREVYGPMSLRA